MIPKAIDGKRKSNKVIKLLANMDTFAQSDYEYDSLHILIKKIVVFPEKGLEFTMLDGSIIKITIPRCRLVDHYGRKKTSGSTHLRLFFIISLFPNVHLYQVPLLLFFH